MEERSTHIWNCAGRLTGGSGERVFSLEDLLYGRPCTREEVALTNVRLWSIDQVAFDTVIHQHPNIAFALYKSVSHPDVPQVIPRLLHVGNIAYICVATLFCISDRCLCPPNVRKEFSITPSFCLPLLAICAVSKLHRLSITERDDHYCSSWEARNCHELIGCFMSQLYFVWDVLIRQIV